MSYGKKLCSTLSAFLCVTALAAPVFAAPPEGKGPKNKGEDDPVIDDPVQDPVSGTYYDWMHSDVQGAWAGGFFGQGVSITVVDDFQSSDVITGNLDGNIQDQTHGQWTAMQAGLIATGAQVFAKDFSERGAVKLRNGFNVLNLSYGMLASAGINVDSIRWSRREQSIVDAAEQGLALVSKSAGNTWGTAVGAAYDDGNGSMIQDYLSLDLIGAQSAIFVGALQTNPDDGSMASIASYSTIAGDDLTVQSQFLVVGVEAGGTSASEFANYGTDCGSVAGTCLYGTSFAAPIVAGYGAILSSKFPSATPSQVAQQLLGTTKTDTLVDLGHDGWGDEDKRVYGRGEASLANALAPVSIN